LPSSPSKAFHTCSGPRADSGTFRQIHPTNRAGSVDQEFGRTGDVSALRSSPRVEQVVTTNHLGLRVRKKRVGKAQILAMPATHLRCVYADGDDAKASRIKIRKPLLETPQLGVTKQSPVAAIENQYRAVGTRGALRRRGKEIGERD